MKRKLDDLWVESKKAGLEINFSKTDEIHVITTVNQELRLNGEDIKRSSDFCYLGSVVAEDNRCQCEGIVLQTEKSVAVYTDMKRY
jgi:hypothetical protein